MSSYWAGWALDQDVAPAEKLMLLVLGDNTTDDGICIGTMRGLVKRMNISDRETRVLFEYLIERGFVRRQKTDIEGWEGDDLTGKYVLVEQGADR